MTLTIEKYRHRLKPYGLLVEDENRFLAALWHIAESTMDLIFGTDSTQLALGLSPRNDSNFTLNPLESKDILSINFNASAAVVSARKAKP